MRIAFALLLAGCVPKGRYELVDVQLQATRTALEASGVRCQDDLRASEERVGTCTDEIAQRQAQLDALTAALEATRAEVAALQAAEAARLAAASVPEASPEAGPQAVLPEAVAEALALASERRRADALVATGQARVASLFAPLAEKGVTVRSIPGGSVVTLPVAKLFNEERTSLSPLGIAILEQAAAALRELADHQLEVRAHTDGQPFHSIEHASAWELGFAWAMGVQRNLNEFGIPMRPTASCFGGTQRLDPGDSPEARKANRRVELVLRLDPDLLTRFPPTPEPEP